MIKIPKLYPAAFFVVIFYLIINTGIASDDFIFTLTMKGKGVAESMDPRICPHTPMESVFFFLWYPFFSLDNMLPAELIKILYILISFYMISCFFGIFLGRGYALLASFLFVFFPSHDSTVYWFLGQYLTLSMAIYLFAYYLAHRDRLSYAFISASVASFLSYGSIAIAIPLFILAVLNREIKKGVVIIAPNIIYTVYYVFIGRLMPTSINRLPENFNMFSIAKQFIFQASTFLDAVFGPSIWLKVYYSILQLSLPSVIVCLAFIFILANYLKNNAITRYDFKLLISLAAMAMLSLGMFALTGAYPQMAFNIGNRVTIFGSLLAAYLIVAAPMNRVFKITALAVLIFSIFGLSDHWKAWNAHQKVVISNIMNNKELANHKDGKTIFVSGNQYSKLGRFSHIEFFSERGPECIFNIILGREASLSPINRRFMFADSHVVDTKYGRSYKTDGCIIVYDSERDSVLKIDEKDINRYIESLPKDIRHWTQLPGFEFLREWVVRLAPRLEYAL